MWSGLLPRGLLSLPWAVVVKTVETRVRRSVYGYFPFLPPQVLYQAAQRLSQSQLYFRSSADSDSTHISPRHHEPLVCHWAPVQSTWHPSLDAGWWGQLE